MYPVVSVCLYVIDYCKQDISQKLIYESLYECWQKLIAETLLNTALEMINSIQDG